MISKNDLTQYAHDVLTNPTTAKTVPAVSAGLGLNEIFGWAETAIGFAALVVSLMVSIALWRKNRLEIREAELRIKVLERDLRDRTR